MDNNRKLHVGLIQMKCEQDKAKNVEKAVAYIHEAVSRNAQIICLQELFNTQYFCFEENYKYFSLAESKDSATFKILTRVAEENNIVIIVPYFEKRADGIYHNSAIVIDTDGTILGNYRKNHIPDDPGYLEKFYFTPGDTGYKVFKTSFATIGVLICWDQWYPEAARITSLMGAQILFFPTAIGWEATENEAIRMDQMEAWFNIQKSHAIANGVFVASVNRTGTENLTSFWGSSFISNPMGKILKQASIDNEEILVEELDLGKIDYYRTRWPFYRDRRVDTYQLLYKRFID